MLTVKEAVEYARQQAREAVSKNDVQGHCSLLPARKGRANYGDKARDGRNKRRRIYDGGSDLQGIPP